jgi:hypothetical protein
MNTKAAGLLVIALIVLIGVGIFSFGNKGNTKEVPSSIAPTAVVKDITVQYKDGVYTQVGDYKSPAGAEQIDVKLTLENGVVVESEVTPKATAPISKVKQEAFAEGYKEMVVGKSIKDLQLGKIAGASLTPKGFNDAVEKIKAEAKAS